MYRARGPEPEKTKREECEMASIIVQDGRMTLKLNTGETEDGKIVYRNMSLSGVKGDAEADDLSAIAEGISALVPFNVEQVSLQRTDILEL
jgi:hypothetical protein